MDTTPTVFISYSHDSPEHKAWVVDIANRLRTQGVDVKLDRWDLRLGDDVQRFMASQIAEADRVLAICTAVYVSKADQRKGGAGYEGQIIDAELAEELNTRKIIPVVREGTTNVVPRFLKGRFYLDFRNDDDFEESLIELVHEIHDVLRTPKEELGSNPFDGDAKHNNVSETEARWQDDKAIALTASQTLELRKIREFSALAEVRERLNLNEFTADDHELQQSRLAYVDKVLTILEGNVGRIEAREISLAGTDQHNNSLRFKNADIEFKEVHIGEIRRVHLLLARRAQEVIDDDEIRGQVLSWLDTDRHNMESTREHSVRMRQRGISS